MKAIIIVHSYHHNNTEKVATAIAAPLNAEIKYPQDVSAKDLQEYDIIGLGAGIDSGKHYTPILEFAETLPDMDGKKAFIFSTCGIFTKKKMFSDHAAMRNVLTGKGYVIVDEFSCAGFNTNSFLKIIGGINKGRPNNEDLQRAKEFAEKLINTI